VEEVAMIAVMGASGNVGSKVVKLLSREHEDVRVLEHKRRVGDIRERGIEVVRGDAGNVGDLEVLFADAAAALVLLPENVSDPKFVANRSRMSRAIVDALRRTGVRYVVALSSVGADRADAVGPPAGLHEFEQRLSELAGVNLLILRSAFYMENHLRSLPLIRSQQINGSAIRSDLAFPMVATRDVAREAAERLRRRDFTGHNAKLLLGPADVSMREATALMGALLGMPDLQYVEFPPDALKQGLIGAGMSEEVATLMVDMQFSLNDGRPFAGVRRTMDSATPTTLEAFLSDALALETVGAADEGGLR